MDFKGIRERYNTFDDEQRRAAINGTNGAEGEAQRQRRASIFSGFLTVCRIASRASGKGPRATTEPIYLSRGGYDPTIIARVTTHGGLHGEPCDFFASAVSLFNTRVTIETTGVSVDVLADEDFHVHSWLDLNSAEQTLKMLQDAMLNPSLNPELQDQVDLR